MAVEIRELVIQARLQESDATGLDKAAKAALGADGATEESASERSFEPDEEWMEQLVERCVLRLREWMAEKSLR
jgi:Family of unknown function (DUF5908)